MKTYEDGYNQALKDYEELKRSDQKRKKRSRKMIVYELSISHAYSLKGFWYTRKNGERDYKVIVTRYDKGYEQALKDKEAHA